MAKSKLKLNIIEADKMGPLDFWAHTGCSKETVNCNFFPTDLKITKIGTTEPFLGGAHREVLIF